MRESGKIVSLLSAFLRFITIAQAQGGITDVDPTATSVVTDAGSTATPTLTDPDPTATSVIDISSAIAISISAAREEAKTSALAAIPTIISSTGGNGSDESDSMLFQMAQVMPPFPIQPNALDDARIAATMEAISAPDVDPQTSNTTRRDGQIKVMVVGDSMTQGAEGDWTWRYRLWQWFKSNNINVDFVGPYSGTRKSVTLNTPPQPPTLYGAPKEEDRINANGRYAADVDPSFDSDHFAIWGRPVAMDQGLINGFVKQYQPDYLLVMLGFNDLGWFYSDEYGLINNMGNFINEARKAKPDLKFAIANVPQRTFIGGRQDLVDKTNNYNKMLPGKLTDWSTSSSPCVQVELRHAYSCDLNDCPAGYDGLHPSSLGDYQIASAFTDVLYNFYKLGSGKLQVPANPPARPVPIPSNFQVASSPSGVTATWSPVFGAYGYYVQYSVNGGAWSKSLVQTNRWDSTWAIEGASYAIKVSTYAGELPGLTSDWTGAQSATAHPQVPSAPQNVKSHSGDGSITVSWDPPTSSGSIVEYEIIIWDQDQDCDFLQSAGFLSSPATFSGLKNGHRYMVAPLAWSNAGRGWPDTSSGDVRVGYSSPPKVSGLTVTAPDDNHVYATWSAVPAAAGYQVWVRNTLNSSDVRQRFAKTINPCFDSWIAYPASWYYEFCFSAFNGADDSGMDAAQCVIPKAPSSKSTPPTCAPPPQWCPGFGSKPVAPPGDGDSPPVSQTTTWGGTMPTTTMTQTTSGGPTASSGSVIDHGVDPKTCKWDYTRDEIIQMFGAKGFKGNERYTDQCIFYHGTFRQQAVNYYCNNRNMIMLTTLYRDLNDDNSPFRDDKGPLACAIANGKKREWFRRVSEILAEVCFGRILYFWDGQAPYELPSSNGLPPWHTQFDWYEYPILVNNGADIQQIDPVTLKTKPYVPPADSSPAPPGHAPPPKDRRTADASGGFTPWKPASDPLRSSPLTKRLSLSCLVNQMRYPNTEQVFSYDSDNGYVEGWCGFHVKQLQKIENSSESYTIDIKDHEGNLIGGTDSKYLQVKTSQLGYLPSFLPSNLFFDAPADTSAAITFYYRGVSWNTDSAQCSVGKYDKGVRQMDCGFGC